VPTPAIPTVAPTFVTPTPMQVGRLSFSARYVMPDTAGIVLTNALLACCEQGPLYQFFATSYPSDAALLDAWTRAGGSITVEASYVNDFSNGPQQPKFRRDPDDGRPWLWLGFADPCEVALRVSLSYSASR
jgi:hypothetical protein